MAEDAAARGATPPSSSDLALQPGLAEDPAVLGSEQMLPGDSQTLPIG
jgi:hypothetical protein